MNGDSTARRVLTWAASPSGAPPSGPLSRTTGLARPTDATLEAARELLRTGAGRAGLPAPVLGDRGPAGAGVILLAAAIGGRSLTKPAARLATAVAAPRPHADGRWNDAAARHFVVAPFLGTVAPPPPLPVVYPASTAASAREVPLPEVLLSHSPLTRVLHRPPLQELRAGTTDPDVRTAMELITRPGGRALLTTTFAAWRKSAEVLGWRSDLMQLLVIGHPDVVIDVYVLARTVHGEEWDERIRVARRELSRPGLPTDLHLQTVRFWAPLAQIRARNGGFLREHPYLDGCQRALQLVDRYRLGARRAA
ncbi:hypothetical protein AB0C38_13630 [Amycolatopsis sp. NPDC048633]|uniref:hypothetical protein n=1 Tax=Amycolatopsis sp. NPDC048633 TaxID=3157095 RepID=UPI003401EDB4